MNQMVSNIKEIIDTTCTVHRVVIPESDRNTIAVNAWLVCGGNQNMLINYLTIELNKWRVTSS